MQNSSRGLILIVEDDDTLRLLTEKQLAKIGFAAEHARNGREAVKKLRNKQYLLILMDIQMPVMDGIEATLAIREWEQQKQKPRTPIVAMTANPNRQLCLDAGMDDFVFKPVMMDQLTKLLDHWTSNSGRAGKSKVAQPN